MNTFTDSTFDVNTAFQNFIMQRILGKFISRVFQHFSLSLHFHICIDNIFVFYFLLCYRVIPSDTSNSNLQSVLSINFVEIFCVKISIKILSVP